MCFFSFSNNESIILSFFLKKTLPYQREGDFIDGHGITLFFHFFLLGNIS
jgi:hypothetical protein